jgi:hypothetical protein
MKELILRPISFEVVGGLTEPTEVRIEERDAQRWVVVCGREVLSKDGGWEHEPNPSSRTDEFKTRTRFASPEEALTALKALYVGVIGEENG